MTLIAAGRSAGAIASDSRLPSGRLVRVTSARVRLALSTSETTVAGAIATAPPSSVKLAEASLPAVAPFRSSSGSSLTAVTEMSRVSEPVSAPPLAVPSPSTTVKRTVRIAVEGLSETFA